MELAGSTQSDFGTINYQSKQVVSISLPSADRVVTDFCGEVDEKTLAEIALPDPDAAAECMGVYSESIYQKDAKTFYVVDKCNETLGDVVKLTHIPNRPLESFGSLSLTSTNFPALDAKATACGSVGSVNVSATNGTCVVSVPSFVVSVKTPYAGSSITATFTFVGTDRKVGTYSVQSAFDQALPTSVQVLLNSTVFDKTTHQPLDVEATKGSVTITKIDMYSASGSYSIEGDNGETFTGQFDVALPAY